VGNETGSAWQGLVNIFRNPRSLFQTKSPQHILAEAAKSTDHLKRALGPIDLVLLGVGAIIGAGIFATTGTAAAGGPHHLGAGPALVISFIFTAVACTFCALCYAEFASLIPIAGSAYTYAYATLGELVAWIIGWDLIIEYAVGNVAVAISWSDYFNNLLRFVNLQLPPWLCTDLRSASALAAQVAITPQVLEARQLLESAPHLFGVPVVFNLLAVLIVAALTVLLIYGIRESTSFNNWMVILKVLILLLFVGVGAFFVRPENWHPFAPNGWKGISMGAALIFFAYIGFDAVTTTAEETRNPGRALPIGIIGSLIICTILYIAVTLVLTGMVPYTTLGTADPLATALNILKLDWVSWIVSLGAVLAMTAVLLVFQLGQPRIFFSMARDGLLPPSFARIHPRFKTPHVTTIVTGVAVAIFAAFANINEVVELTNIGTLFAFVLVCLGVLILRYRDPDLPRPFRTPFHPWVPILGILSCVYLMASLPLITWARFGIWLLCGMAIYLLYGHRHSRLRKMEAEPGAENSASTPHV